MEYLDGMIGLSLEEMQEHPSLIINAFDKDHIVLFWNNCCAAHFGISTEKALGKKLEDIVPWTKNDEKILYIDRALMGKSMQIMKVPYSLKKGYYEQRVLSIKDNEGKTIAALNIVEEING